MTFAVYADSLETAHVPILKKVRLFGLQKVYFQPCVFFDTVNIIFVTSKVYLSTS